MNWTNNLLFAFFALLCFSFATAHPSRVMNTTAWDSTFIGISLKCKHSHKKNSEEIHCSEYCKNIKRPYIGAPYKSLSCIYIQQNFLKKTPLERALDLRQEVDFLPEEKKLPGNSITIYQCPNSETVLFEKRYGDDFYSLVQFRTDGEFSWSDYCGESFFKRNTQKLFAYICGLKGKEILNTHQFPVFPADAILSNKDESSPGQQIVLSQQNTPLPPQQTFIKKIQEDSSDEQKGQQAAVMPIQLHSNAWNVLGDYFYPADVPGNLISMRRFETKNKSKEIKINFSSQNKQPFLEKLKNTHRYHPARQTDCTNGGTLYETVSDGIYQAYILSENAITVFSAAYNLPTLPEEPHAARMQKEFCALDVSSKW